MKDRTNGGIPCVYTLKIHLASSLYHLPQLCKLDLNRDIDQFRAFSYLRELKGSPGIILLSVILSLLPDIQKGKHVSDCGATIVTSTYSSDLVFLIFFFRSFGLRSIPITVSLLITLYLRGYVRPCRVLCKATSEFTPRVSL